MLRKNEANIQNYFVYLYSAAATEKNKTAVADYLSYQNCKKNFL